jgi:membrane-associated phospholipid phosphatase
MRFWSILAIGLLLIIVGFCYLDQPITLWSSDLHMKKVAKAVSWLIAPETHLVAWPLVFFTAFYLCRNLKAKTLLLFVISIPLCILAVDLLKLLFGRYRPEEWLEKGLYGFSWLGTNQSVWSFPSGHTATIGGIMASLSCLRPRLIVLWALIAFLLSTCRIFALEHFFSDLIASLTVCFVLTPIVYQLTFKRRPSL